MSKRTIKREALLLLALGTFVSAAVSGCAKAKKEEEPQGPVEEVLTAVTMADLQQGNFYVKSGDSFFLLPMEGQNFDLTRETMATDNTKNGFTDPEANRLLDFIYKDQAIPTLYKNDQLIYVSSGSVNSFIWERFKDYGYSIGVSGMILSESGKVKSGDKTTVAAGSSVEPVIASMQIPDGSDLTVDAINQTLLSDQYLNDGGIITGMSRDAVANVDFYVGTQHIPATASADTRYFKSFELYETTNYSLSTDGYAIVEVPSYFKSGYYMINNGGFFKFLNVDRGIDESGIDLSVPYYYQDQDGRTLTFYEWQESQGIVQPGTVTAQNPVAEDNLNPEDYPERYSIVVDSTQEAMVVSVSYKYTESTYRTEASRTGKFPKAILIDPAGKAVQLAEDESKTYGRDNKDGYTYLSTEIESPMAGAWTLLYNNFENTYKIVDVDIQSGNATSYIHNSYSGGISIYYDASDATHDFTITWENADHAARDITITAPDGTEYSKNATPGNVMADEYGRFVLKVPYIQKGEYRFAINGDQLGRVWISCDESVPLPQETVPADGGETSETGESGAEPEGETAEAEEGGESAESTEAAETVAADMPTAETIAPEQ